MKQIDSELAHDLREIVVGLYRQMQKHISNDEKLSVAAQNVLYQLTQSTELLPSELCNRLHISSQYISQVFNQLESLQYIIRKPSASDGRKTLVSLTEKGRQKVLESRREREAWLADQIAERFSGEEQEIIGKAVTLLRGLTNQAPQ